MFVKKLRYITFFLVEIVFALSMESAQSDHHSIKVVAHKGANEFAPENTYASAQLAIKWGVDYVEIDVSRSADGIFYLFHGPEITKTVINYPQNPKAMFHELTSQEIDTLDVGSWFHPAFARERPPRLMEFLYWIRGKAKVFLDVKDGSPMELLTIVREADMLENCFFWHRDDAWALELRRLNSRVAIKINVKNALDVALVKEKFSANIVEVRTPDLTPKLVEACHKAHVKLMVFEPAKDIAAFKRIRESGADMINLDHADQFYLSHPQWENVKDASPFYPSVMTTKCEE